MGMWQQWGMENYGQTVAEDKNGDLAIRQNIEGRPTKINVHLSEVDDLVTALITMKNRVIDKRGG